MLSAAGCPSGIALLRSEQPLRNGGQRHRQPKKELAFVGGASAVPTPRQKAKELRQTVGNRSRMAPQPFGHHGRRFAQLDCSQHRCFRIRGHSILRCTQKWMTAEGRRIVCCAHYLLMGTCTYRIPREIALTGRESNSTLYVKQKNADVECRRRMTN
jgi:hypothetical protein